MAVKKTTPKDRAAARSKMKQGDQAKTSAARAARPGKVSEAGMANIPASIARLGKVAIDAYRKGTQAAAKPKATSKPKPASADTQRKIAAEMRATKAKADKEMAIKNAARADRAKAGKAADARQAGAEKYKAVYGSKTDRTYDRKPLGPSGKKPTSQRMKDSKGNMGWR